MTDYGWPDSHNLAYFEELYQQYLRGDADLPARWREWFESRAGETPPDRSWRPTPHFPHRSIFNPPGANGNGAPNISHQVLIEALQDRVDQLVRTYRVRGHMIAKLDPLELPRPPVPELEPSFHGFTDADLDRKFSARTIQGADLATLREIIERLRDTYCRYIGVQFMHIDDLEIRHWLQNRMEGTRNRLKLTNRQQYRIFTRLTDAVVFEEFIQKKFIGAKRFSLEGAESLIPLLDLSLEKAGAHGIDEVVIGMAHRGRLNVLANILGKRPAKIFREFEDKDPEAKLGRGDVKYHLGYASDWETAAGKAVHVALCFNPSHLEFVNPVALGRVRAKQDRHGDTARDQHLTILIHGDAAFAGEGIVQETLNLSELPAYTTGGTLHVIVNNQLGFTTSPEAGRSSLYASAIGKMLQIPIFHVNGEHPESVAKVVNLAMDFRKIFKRDVIIDMYCYRKHGHNEGDEPAFTQPLLYKTIKRRKSVRDGYLDHLLKLGGITREAADEIQETTRERLEQHLEEARSGKPDEPPPPSTLRTIWSKYKGGRDADVDDVDTGVPHDTLVELLSGMTRVPAGFTPNKKITRLLELQQEMAAGRTPVAWATAELLAFASLAVNGTRVRLTGQDSERGTFSQRHSVLHDQKTGEKYMPLNHLAPNQAEVEIYNSPLSEAGVMGYEYGYSIASPDALVLWEAQFGDFINAAQVIVDQFLTSAEDKWHSLSGIVLLLPHGFEGQGPEHSSARLERFLQACAEDNIQVCNCTTAAQYFHLLRRQVVRPWRKPLIIMTPKSLLRDERAASNLDRLTTGRFQRVLPDDSVDPKQVKRVLLCSGKIYYDLEEKRAELDRDDVAIVRIEQLYPLRCEHLEQALGGIPDGAEAVWVQEEPENMGAWSYMKSRWCDTLLGRFPFRGISRRASASPATGSRAAHVLEQERLVSRAFANE